MCLGLPRAVLVSMLKCCQTVCCAMLCCGCAGDLQQMCDDVLAYMASHPSVAKFAVPDDCVVVQVRPYWYSATRLHLPQLCACS
jgi:hypothetical protein